MESFQPELIHSHHPFLLGDAAIREAGYRGLPIVFTHHTRYEDYVHYLFEDSQALERLARELATGYANLCDRVVVPSESIRNLVTSRGVRAPVSVVPTGVRIDRFAGGNGAAFRAAHGIPAEAPLVGHIGRIEPEKNVEYLVRAVCLHLDRDPECWFLLAGEGRRTGEVRRLVEAAGAGGRTVLLGRLAGDELSGAYRAMDVFVFASRSETQGLVLAEAMAAGSPVIALDAPGAREIVRDGENGYLLPEASPVVAFADALGRWRSLPGEVRREWREAVARTVAAFSLDACTGRLEAVYAQLLEDRGAIPAATPWEQLMGRFEAEWELALGKARAASALLKKRPD